MADRRAGGRPNERCLPACLPPCLPACLPGLYTHFAPGELLVLVRHLVELVAAVELEEEVGRWEVGEGQGGERVEGEKG